MLNVTKEVDLPFLLLRLMTATAPSSGAHDTFTFK